MTASARVQSYPMPCEAPCCESKHTHMITQENVRLFLCESHEELVEDLHPPLAHMAFARIKRDETTTGVLVDGNHFMFTLDQSTGVRWVFVHAADSNAGTAYPLEAVRLHDNSTIIITSQGRDFPLRLDSLDQ